MIHAVDPSYVSERLLHGASAMGRVLTPMQVLKLVYISHGWMLGLLDQPLVAEAIEAWRGVALRPRSAQRLPEIPELSRLYRELTAHAR